MAVWSCGFEAGYEQFYIDAGFYFNGTGDRFTNTAGEFHQSINGNGGTWAYVADDGWIGPVVGTTGRWVNYWAKPINPGTSYHTIQFYRYGNAQCGVNFTNSGNIQIRRGFSTSGTILAYGTYNPNIAHWISIECLAANAGGAINVYVDGSLRATYSGDTQQQVDADWDQFGGAGSNQFVAYDDMIITTVSEGRLTEHFLPAITPSSDSTPLQLTPSTGTTHYNLVNTLPISASTPDTYNKATATGQEDLYGLSDLGWSPASVHAVQGWGYVTRAGGVTQGQLWVKSSATASYQTAEVLPASGQYTPLWNVWNLDPNGSIAWTGTSVNALLAGVKFT